MGIATGVPARRGAHASHGETSFNSLAMAMLVEQAGDRSDWRVLDLGPAFGSSLDFLSRFASRIFIEDLYHTLVSTGRQFSGEGRQYCPLYDALLPYDAQEPFDLILLWNLLDYLDREEITRLASHLASLARPGTIVHALVSTRQKIPASPTAFKITGNGQLVHRDPDGTQCDGPRYGQVRLLELMRGYRVKRSFLLRNGLQEYLFEIA